MHTKNWERLFCCCCCCCFFVFFVAVSNIYYSFSFVPPLEWLRPLARTASNTAIFAPNSDPALIAFENSISDTNRMYAMKTIGIDCSDQPKWTRWLEDGRQAVVGNKIPCALIVGEYDGIFSLESTERLKEMMEIPDKMYHVIKGVGHLPMLEKGEEVLAILQDFLCNFSGSLECVDRTNETVKLPMGARFNVVSSST